MITDIVPKNIPLDNVFIPAIASGLASLGRFEDTYMVHAAKGETVIPKEVLDANPGLKEELFQQMIDMGIENPQRYVVGENLNSINPITGQPEFFFSSLKRFFKRAAPTIGGAIGGYLGGPWGAAIGSGLGSKVAGQSTEQALMNAALAGAGSYFLGPKTGASELIPGSSGERMAAGLYGLTGGAKAGLLSGFNPAKLASGIGGGLGGLSSGFLTEGGDAKGDSAARVAAQGRRRSVVGRNIAAREAAAGRPTSPQFPGRQLVGGNLTDEEYDLLRERFLNRRPTFRTTPASAVAVVPSEQEQALIDRMLAGQNVGQSQFPLDVRLRPITPTVLNAHRGGMVPGRRAQNKDTVPAVLTPGEFVFTQDAVRGAAPNGTRQQQARAMYNIMRGLEGRA